MDALIKTYYVPELDTLDVWFGDTTTPVESVEIGDGVISKLGKNGEVISVEIIGLSKTSKEDLDGLPSDVRSALLEVIRKLCVATSGLA
ncbi:MAG TPA: DUF2283 domain-containing protein [Nitrososphaerales archaeon]|nr:DUF2283 domain-containing protein [Nitrososphaerales archaeon]